VRLRLGWTARAPGRSGLGAAPGGQFDAAHFSSARIGPFTGLGQNAPRNWCGGTDRSMASLTPVSSELRRRRSGLYRRIATMDASAPLPSLPDQAPIWASASTLVRSWGLNQLADRLEGKA
jgi:hypothetical protein